MMYRVEFQITYGGRYYSETFTDLRDVRNLWSDLNEVQDWVRPMGVEVSEDGEVWEPFPEAVGA